MKIALIQINSGDDKAKNLRNALRLTLKAIQNETEFILLPEAFNYRGRARGKNGHHDIAEIIPGESTAPFMMLARRYRVFILLGSLYEKGKGAKAYNTSVFINSDGRIAARYRKIHLFKLRHPGNTIDESAHFISGRKPQAAYVRNFKIGLSICYDVRFPQLYAGYKKAGTEILCAPSSFTQKTGRAHWEVLLRARAIENLSYVLAPAQFGKTPGGVVTYGHSLVVGPWGNVLARGSGNREEIIYANLSKEAIRQCRKKLPGI